MKAAIIGYGRMGQNHALALTKLGISDISAADINQQNQMKFLMGNNNRRFYSDYQQLLKNERPDLVCVATTADSHNKISVDAIDSGTEFICIEKPLATSLASCHEIQKLASSNNVRVAVNHQMRFLPQYIMPKEKIQSSIYGGMQSMTITAGNFGLAMNGTHYIEAFRFMTDEKPTEVTAWFDKAICPNPRGIQFEDVSGCIRVTTNSNKRLYIDTSADQGHGVQVTYMARNGRITVDELTGTMTTVVRKPEYQETPTSRYGMPVDIEEHKIQPVELVDSTKAVLKALIDGEDYPTLSDASLAVKTLIAAYHSHRKGGVSVGLADIPNNDPEIFPWA